MLEMFGLPNRFRQDVQIFRATSQVNGQGYQVWTKPRGVSMAMMIAIGGGGGGGGGFTRTAGNAGGGGAGGACSGLGRFLCPAILLPDLLYLQVGAGGKGGVASANGNAGINSFILSSKTAVLPNIILSSGVNAPGGGTAGSGAAAGTGGTVPTVAATQPCHTWGQWFAIVGLVGVAGGTQTGAVGTDVTAWGTIPLSPGAGGAGSLGSDFAGGNQTPTALLDFGNQGYFPAATGAIAKGGTAAGAGVDGGGGVSKLTPFFNSGGSGGGSNNSGQAGHGGAGGFGCGGGGGGAGATAGMGGNGGDGLIMIFAW